MKQILITLALILLGSAAARDCDVIHIEYIGDANNRAVFNAAEKNGGRMTDYLLENITIEEPRPWRLFKFNLIGDTSVDNTTFRKSAPGRPAAPRKPDDRQGLPHF